MRGLQAEVVGSKVGRYSVWEPLAVRNPSVVARPGQPLFPGPQLQPWDISAGPQTLYLVLEVHPNSLRRGQFKGLLHRINGLLGFLAGP